jgi:hypothetical protein
VPNKRPGILFQDTRKQAGKPDNYMRKPKQPPNFTEYMQLWRDYFARKEKYLAGKREQGKRYRIKHYEKEAQRHKTARRLNLEKYREYGRKYRQSPKGRQAVLENSYRFLDNHPEIPEQYLKFVEQKIRETEKMMSLSNYEM